MSPKYTMPGIYIQEVPSGVPRIEGVPTAITGFIGRAARGPINDSVLITSFTEYERVFGGLWSEGPLSYTLQHYFLNGGEKAVIVRVNKGPGQEDGGVIGFAEVADPGLKEKQNGLWAFDKTDMLNLLCIPPFGWQEDVDTPTWKAALDYCKARRAFLIVDPPSTWKNCEDAKGGIDGMGIRDGNTAIYFPRLRMADPLGNNQLRNFAPCGAVAGVIAHMDKSRGVWKAPAGMEAILNGVADFSYSLTDEDERVLAGLGINSLRKMNGEDRVIWGARTLLGDYSSDSEWKYINVRRTELYIEESISRGLEWVVFEPNEEPLWQKIRWTINDFLEGLWQQGILLGDKPQNAYFVRCDLTTMTQRDIDQGMVVILMGYALLRPSEFFIFRLTQWTADTARTTNRVASIK